MTAIQMLLNSPRMLLAAAGWWPASNAHRKVRPAEPWISDTLEAEVARVSIGIPAPGGRSLTSSARASSADRFVDDQPERAAQVPALLKPRTDATGGDLTVIDVSSEQGWSGLWRRFDNGRRILQAEGPVLLVRGEPETNYRSVVVAVDFSPQSVAAARAALAFAPRARFRFVHVLPAAEAPPLFDFGNRSQITQALRRKGREIVSDELGRFVSMLDVARPVKRVVLHGAPGPTIASYARNIGADLLVCATSAGAAWKQMLRPGVAMELSASGCDVLIASTRADVSEHAVDRSRDAAIALTEDFRQPILGIVHPRPT